LVWRFAPPLRSAGPLNGLFSLGVLFWRLGGCGLKLYFAINVMGQWFGHTQNSERFLFFLLAAWTYIGWLIKTIK